MRRQRVDFLVNIAYYGVILLLFFLLCRLSFLMMPFIIGFVISVIIYPVVGFMKKRLHVPAPLTAGVLVVAILSLLAGIVFLLSFLLYQCVADFAEQIPELLETVESNIFSLVEKSGYSLSPSQLDGLRENISSSAVNMSLSLLRRLSSSAASLPSFFIFFAASVISCILFCCDMLPVRAFLRGFLPVKLRAVFLEIQRFSSATLGKMLRAYLMIVLLTFAELSAGFAVIGVENPFGLAALIALVDILPVLGCGTVLIPWAVIAALEGSVSLAVKLAVLYVIIACVREFAEPRIVGSNLGLHPLAALAAVYLGFRLCGIFGMFVFPILFITLTDLWKKGFIGQRKTET